jgi:PASTA domain
MSIRRAAAVLAVGSLLFAVSVAPASAVPPSGSATLAPIGTGSYLVTVKNTGSVAIEAFSVVAEATTFAPSTCNSSTVGGAITCSTAIAPGGESQMCYSGPAATEARLNLEVHIPVTTAAGVSSCPVAGFTPTATKPGTTSTTTTTTNCVVPNVKNKTLGAAEKAITTAHCKVGKIKKERSKHVKKGRVISESPKAGKSLPSGTKVNLTVSK